MRRPRAYPVAPRLPPHALGLLWLLSLVGCDEVPASFHCDTATQCGTAGWCEPTGYCSLRDSSCASGRRYRYAGPFDEQCVAEDGGTPVGDGSSGDGGDLGQPSLCGEFTGLRCEDFEGVTLGSDFSVDVRTASFALDTSRSARGAAAGHFQLGPSTATGQTYGGLMSPSIPATGTVAARAFFFFPAPPPYSDSRLLAIQQPSGSFQHIHVGFHDGKLKVHSSVTNAYKGSTVDLPIGRWFCLELVIAQGTAGSVRTYLDGEELIPLQLLNENTQASPALSDFAAGIAVDTPGVALPASENWIDEVAVDTARIGCTR